ncbi:MAG TPA: methyltransferase domain-containing protein [Pseudolabrys sp.]
MTDTAADWQSARAAFAKGDVAQAIACIENVVRLNPADLEAYRVLGRILRNEGRMDEAAAWYRRCLAIAPDDGVAAMGLAALGQAPAPARLPDDVVLYVFDRNADSYEGNMRSLGYNVPATLLALLRAEGGAQHGTLDILDLGCGSGLCGPLFRPLARKLAGVDLSPRMLALAAGKQVYDELIQAELLDYLARAPASCDLVVAANVFCYFADLGPLAQGIARALRAGGRLLFDVEKGAGAEASFQVNGRFTHSLTAIERALQPAGFAFSRFEETPMRVEGGKPVLGLYCLAQRSG